jgi:hypothetical protein
MTRNEIAGWVLGFFAVAYFVIRECIKRPSPGDADHASPKERMEAMKKRQEAALERMEQQGIRSLLKGRPAWARINPMGVAPESKKVVRMKGRA